MKNLQRVRAKGHAFAAMSAILVFSCGATAAGYNYVATPTKILIDDANYGGCMVQTSPGPESVAPSCKAGFVSVDCSGAYFSKSIAATKLGAIQLAFVTSGRLFLRIDDAKKHNGYCVVRRADNLSS